MTVPVLPFEQFTFGEALKTEGRDIYSAGRAVEDELDEAGACRGGGLEAGAA